MMCYIGNAKIWVSRISIRLVITRHLEMFGITDLSVLGILKRYAEIWLEFSNMLSFASDTCSVMKVS